MSCNINVRGTDECVLLFEKQQQEVTDDDGDDGVYLSI